MGPQIENIFMVTAYVTATYDIWYRFLSRTLAHALSRNVRSARIRDESIDRGDMEESLPIKCLLYAPLHIPVTSRLNTRPTEKKSVDDAPRAILFITL